MIEARFDDLLPGAERSFRLAEPVGVIEARRAGEVPDAIEAADAAASRGLWAAGYVAYEAAPGLDPELAVRVRAPDDPFAEMPLAWFALFERKDDVPPVLLESAARSRRWAESYNVRLELVLQPRTPLALALGQLTSLVRRDLVRVSKARALRPLVRAAALRALDGRWEGLPPGDKSRGIREID